MAETNILCSSFVEISLSLGRGHLEVHLTAKSKQQVVAKDQPFYLFCMIYIYIYTHIHHVLGQVL